MAVSNKNVSRSTRHIGRQYLICHSLVVLLLQISTSEAVRIWNPQAYGITEPRPSPSLYHLVPYLASYPSPQKPDANPTPYTNVNTNLKLLNQQKLINEQQILHFAMGGHPPFPPRGSQPGRVPQIFPPKQQGNQFLHHAQFTQIVPGSAQNTPLPIRRPSPATPASTTRTSNSVSPRPTKKPDQNPTRNTTYNPAQNPTPNPAQNPTHNPAQNSTHKPSSAQPSRGGGSSKPETVTGPSDGGKRSVVCYSKPEVGRCRGAFKRYYYNVTLDQCDCFFFGGCEDRAASRVAEDTYLGSHQQCLKTCTPGNKMAGPRCSGSLKPPVFFLDRSAQAKKNGTKSRDVENREENPARK